MRKILSCALGLALLCPEVLAQPATPKDKPLDGDALQEVVVTGTGTSNLLKNTPVHTEVITRKMLDNYGGKSVEEILSGLTSSFAFNEGDMGSQMQLNGLGNNYILILIDGKRIHGDVGGENDLGLINPHNIEKIEIVRGAQSALYGSDAIAGVVNIITRKPATANGQTGLSLENATRYGSHNDLRQHNGIGFRIGNLQSNTTFQLQHNDGWQNTPLEYAEAKLLTDSRNKTANKYTNWQIAERLTYDYSKQLSLYANGSYYEKRISRPTDGHHPSCDVYTYDLKYRNASAAMGGSYKFKDAGGKDAKQSFLDFDVSWNKHAYYYLYTDTTLADGYYRGQFTAYLPYFPDQLNLQSDQQRVMANVKCVFYLPYSNTINTGIEYRYDYLHAPMRVISGKANDWTAAYYVQDEFNYVPWLNITAGLRLIENGAFGFRATPKVSVMLSAGDFRLRLGWSEGFKTPTPKELKYHYLHAMGSSMFYYMGNTNLKPQISNYLSANVEYRTNRFSFSVMGYYNALDNMITLVNVPVSEIPVDATTSFMGDGSMKVTPRMYKNAEKAKTYGIDVNASLNITKELSITANYSYLDTEADIYDSAKGTTHRVVIDGMAHHKWNAFANWDHAFGSSYRLGLNLSTRGSSKRYYQNDGDGKAFQIWRLNTTHSFPARSDSKRTTTYRVEFGIDNIFNYCDTTPHPYHLGTNTSGTTVFANFVIRFATGKKLSKNTIKTKNENNEED